MLYEQSKYASRGPVHEQRYKFLKYASPYKYSIIFNNLADHVGGINDNGILRFLTAPPAGEIL